MLNKLSKNNIFCGVVLMPVLPFLQDNKENIIDIVNLAYKNGANFIYPAFGVTLRDTQRDWFYKYLDINFPGTKYKYIKQYGNDYKCKSPNFLELWNVFKEECNKYGLLYKMEDIIEEYKKRNEYEQITIF